MASRGKESALDLAKFVDKSIRVKLAGGREGENLAIDDAQPKLKPLPLGARSLPPPVCPLAPEFPASSCTHLSAVVGVLKGYDQLLNLVLDEAVEYLRGVAGAAVCAALDAASAHAHVWLRGRFVCPISLPRSSADPEDPMRVTDQTRPMGLIVCRGTSVMLVVPTAGTEEIANPFQQEMEG
jgi:U6 snRNA-associated Sm-like protein LSm7